MGVSKPYTVAFPLTAKDVGDINQMFIQLYKLTTTVSGPTVAQVLARVVAGV